MAPILATFDTCMASATVPNTTHECLVETMTQYNRYYYDYALSRQRDTVNFVKISAGLLILIVVLLGLWSGLSNWFKDRLVWKIWKASNINWERSLECADTWLCCRSSGKEIKLKTIYYNETPGAMWITFKETGNLQEEFVESHKQQVDEVLEKESLENPFGDEHEVV